MFFSRAVASASVRVSLCGTFRNNVSPLRSLSCHSSRAFSASSPSLTEEDAGRKLPVAIFIDLDNVIPSTLSRLDMKKLTQPLRVFGETAGEITLFRAFGNKSTKTYVSEVEKERLRLAQQPDAHDLKDEWLEQNEHMLTDDFGDFDEMLHNEWDQSIGASGFDLDGILRCGVCGGKMKLSKKDKSRGLTLHDKLDKHMRMLHDREQEKRQTRMKMVKNRKKGRKVPNWAKLSEKEREKFRKYESAQVGLWRMPALRDKKAAKRQRGRPLENDAFRILREEGVQCRLADDVDTALINAASSWMEKARQNRDEHQDLLGCVVVVSEDRDFRDILSHKDFVTVSATPKSTLQTKSLVTVSDIVMSREDDTAEIDDTVEGVFGPLIAKPITGKGTKLLERMEMSTFYPINVEDYILDEVEGHIEQGYDDDNNHCDEESYDDEHDADRLGAFMVQEGIGSNPGMANDIWQHLSDYAQKSLHGDLNGVDRNANRLKHRNKKTLRKKIDKFNDVMRERCLLWKQGREVRLNLMPYKLKELKSLLPTTNEQSTCEKL